MQTNFWFKNLKRGDQLESVDGRIIYSRIVKKWIEIDSPRLELGVRGIACRCPQGAQYFGSGPAAGEASPSVSVLLRAGWSNLRRKGCRSVRTSNSKANWRGISKDRKNNTNFVGKNATY